jgi:transcriptional antiterminator Rof (Rho-off)
MHGRPSNGQPGFRAVSPQRRKGRLRDTSQRVYVFSVAAICQDIVGRCSFIDVLEEAVLVHRPVAVALRDGTRFIDVVVDVVTENGEDYAVFHNRERVPVTEIAATTRADPHVPRRP